MADIAAKPDLLRLLDEARKKVAAMTPAERRAMHEAQRKSWVVGELMMGPENAGSGLTREEAEAIYSRVMNEEPSDAD